MRNYRKPLIVFAPKKLLRHKGAGCKIEEFSGQFKTIIEE